jgi:tripartite-type tricarboxylate transporter receptor subunit TctC
VRKHFRTMLGAGIAAGLVATAHAQTYPSKPIKIIVPTAPSGLSDTTARIVGQKLSDRLGQPVIIENKPGAGQNIGAEQVARSPADGYTLLLGSTTHAINATLYKKLPYDLQTSLMPVSRLTSGPLILVVNPKVPANSVKELIALGKSQPLTFASSNPGASTHLAGEMFKARTGVDAVHVPYKGSGPAITDVMGGQVSYMFDTMLTAMPHVKAGKLKALAVTSAARSPMAPELPTMIESGLPGFEAIAWNGLFAPVGTPGPVVAKLNAELKAILDMPDVKEKFAAQGFTSSWQSQQAFGEFVKSEIGKWGALVKSSGATAD